MLTILRSSLVQGRYRLTCLVKDPTLRRTVRILAYILSAFLLSSASLLHYSLPFGACLVYALPGMPGVLAAIGSSVGYLVFWGGAGRPGVVWTLAALVIRLLVKNSRPLLLPTVSALVCALTGLLVQDGAPPLLFLLRIALAMGGAMLFATVLERRDSVADWLLCGVAVLALAQVAPLPILCLGYPAAAAITVAGSFPAAAMAGLALDLAGVSPVSMTAVLCLAWFSRFALDKRLLRAIAPAVVYPVVMALTGSSVMLPLPGLLVGGLLGLCIPGTPGYTPRRGEVGVAQVRLELASSVLRQMQQLLLELPKPTVDEAALLQKACANACGSCSARRNCPGKLQARTLSPELLTQLPDTLPISCRRSGRLLQELRRSGDQLRLLRAGQSRSTEYRTAMIRQYRFLSEYLQELSDELTRRGEHSPVRYAVSVSFCANRPMADNGDRCLSFTGPGGCHYVALCDGMGTGLGAVDEGRTAAETLRRLLCAGFPAQHALSTLNMLCALRDRAGAVTVDLAQIHLDTGRVELYKWGAAPSWRVSDRGCEKIGTVGPPPGLSVEDDPEAAHRLSLRRGEILAMLSDGAGGEVALRSAIADVTEPLDALAARVISSGDASQDDATVALIRLDPVP